MPSRHPLALVVLGMLAEESLHPYAMRRRIGDRAYDQLPGVRATSLYDVVRRLAAADLIRADETSRDGNRPERTGYTITAAGLETLNGWVAETLADTADRDGFASALAFMYALGPDRVSSLLQGRLDQLTSTVDATETALAQAYGNPIFMSDHRYLLAQRQAECDWIAGFLTDLRTGKLAWPSER